MKELFEFIYDLITEFDEMGFVPTTTIPEDPEVYAIRWRDAMIEALEDLSKQSEDLVDIATVKKWLYQIAINNVGCFIEGDFSNACEEIISRLDGLKSFAEETKGADT